MDADEKQIQKTREATAKDIGKAVKSVQAGKCGYLATHVGGYTDSHVPYLVSWYSEEEKQPDSPYLSFQSVLSEDTDAVFSASFCTPGKLIAAPADRAWRVDDTAQLRTHLLNDDDLAKEIFSKGAAPYEDTRKALLSIPKCPPPKQTAKLLHQVYFPMEDGSYHLLSVLPSSIVLHEIRKRHSNMLRQGKEAREKKAPFDSPSSPIPLAFGGAHPLNVSALAAPPHPAAFPSFCSAAPSLRLRQNDRPRNDFFRHCYYTKNMKDDFLVFFNAIRCRKYEEKQTCLEARDRILDVWLEQIYLLRSLSAHWSDEEAIHLDVSEQHLLDIGYAKELEDSDFEDVRDSAQAFARRLFRFLMRDNKLVKEGKLSFDDEDAFKFIGDSFYKELLLCFA